MGAACGTASQRGAGERAPWGVWLTWGWVPGRVGPRGQALEGAGLGAGPMSDACHTVCRQLRAGLLRPGRRTRGQLQSRETRALGGL